MLQMFETEFTRSLSHAVITGLKGFFTKVGEVAFINFVFQLDLLISVQSINTF